MKKHVIITGGSKGLGKYLASRIVYNKDIESLTLISRNNTDLSTAVSEIKKTRKNLQIYSVSSDLSSPKGITCAIEKMKALDLNFNILINNASASGIGSLNDLSSEDISKTIYLNLTAPILLTKFFLPYARRNRWGRIINISSISTQHPSPYIIPYITAKAGVNKLTECIHISEVANGITCNTILPGLMLTDMGKAAIKCSFPSYCNKNSAMIEKHIKEQFPLKKFTAFKDIYSAINFLISSKASHISGEYIRIASGLI
jgi:NAD(P)-dependent dehydrogenase (short-subunit alcohol dehydrogenase family)